MADSSPKMDGKSKQEDSPSHNSQQTVSDDDEIDYSTKPEFYDPNLDDKDELWVQKQRRKGHTSDAVLCCPACFTTLCFDCQRHEKYVTQYRAMFVVNCKITEKVYQPGSKRKRNKRSQEESGPTAGETYKRVCCSVCSTEVGVIDEEEIYHFLNVLPSEG